LTDSALPHHFEYIGFNFEMTALFGVVIPLAGMNFTTLNAAELKAVGVFYFGLDGPEAAVCAGRRSS